MVTFVCNYCDLTLKKKQVQNHIRGRCSPGAMICIDCSQVFHGNDHKDHTSCISQQDKHWGQYAPKKTKQISKQDQHHNVTKKNDNIVSKQQNEKQTQNKQKHEQNKTKTNGIHQQLINENGGNNEWKGWKNQIKDIITNSTDGKIEKSKLRKKLLKVYNSKNQVKIQAQQFNQMFQQKVKKVKNIKQQIIYSLD